MIKSCPAIESAFRNGKLFAHMLELRGDPCKTDFFDALAGRKGFNSEFHLYAKDERGVAGLPMTVLKKGLSTPLWTDMNAIGLLFDGTDEKNVQPIFFHSRDAFSSVVHHVLNVNVDKMPQIAQALGYEPRSGAMLDLSESDPARVAAANRAMDVYWELRASGEHPQLDNTINEVTTITHLRGLRALVVDERACCTGHKDTARYQKQLADADRLSQVLHERYPDYFPHRLPVVSYNPNRRQPFVEITPDMLASRRVPPHFLLTQKEMQSSNRRA